MHLWWHPYATHWGGEHCRSIELATPVKQPHCYEDVMFGLYYMIDANLGDDVYPSMTGVIGMLAGGCVDSVCSRQHHKAAESATTEAVAGGTGRNHLVTLRGVLHELHVPQVLPTPAFFDASAAIFFATNDAAAKRAIWLRRRIAVLRQGVQDEELEPLKVPEEDNGADMHTKYLPFGRWQRHVRWVSSVQVS